MKITKTITISTAIIKLIIVAIILLYLIFMPEVKHQELNAWLDSPLSSMKIKHVLLIIWAIIALYYD